MIKCCGYVAEKLDYLSKNHRHIAKSLEAHWGTPWCNTVFHQLLTQSRNKRKGFPMDVYTVILQLYVVHLGEFGSFDSPITLADLNFNLALLDEETGGHLRPEELAPILQCQEHLKTGDASLLGGLVNRLTQLLSKVKR